jgi:hypothetical protein
MATKIHFVSLEQNENPASAAIKLSALWDACGAGGRFGKGSLVAVKTHFGEKGNTTHIDPAFVKTVVAKLKQAGCKPFLAETSTLYKGNRMNAVDHIALAQEHGFGFDAVGAPIVMMDGLLGDAEEEVEIPGRHFKKVNVAREVPRLHGIVVLSHLTAHPQAGFGAAIKNLGMGLASRRGKRKQHSVVSPKVDPAKCTACGACIEWCPEDAVSMVDGKAFIENARCIGCGECMVVCAFEAIPWDEEMESVPLQEMMAEHAAGVVKAAGGRLFYFNFLINITKNCDCEEGGRILSPDIGIVAGSDLVAVDAATRDIFRERNGTSIEEASWPKLNGLVQIEHARRLGLGGTEYELVEVGA